VWDRFAENAWAYGQFDLTMLDVGAYKELWKSIHLAPGRGGVTYCLARWRSYSAAWSFYISKNAKRDGRLGPQEAFPTAVDRSVGDNPSLFASGDERLWDRGSSATRVLR
jgi:hypothetical protein